MNETKDLAIERWIRQEGDYCGQMKFWRFCTGFCLLVLLLMAANDLRAGTIGCVNVPVATPDSQPVCANAPGLGFQLKAIAGQTAEVWWEDQFVNSAPWVPVGFDHDLNDARSKEKISAYAPGFVQIDMWYVSSTSAHTDLLSIGDSPFIGLGGHTSVIVAEGSTVAMFMDDTTSGHIYAAGINPEDGVMHDLGSQTVPEPGTWIMLSAGLGLIGLSRLRRKAA